MKTHPSSNLSVLHERVEDEKKKKNSNCVNFLDKMKNFKRSQLRYKHNVIES